MLGGPSETDEAEEVQLDYIRIRELYEGVIGENYLELNIVSPDFAA